MSRCSVAAYSFTGITTRPKEIAPAHMLRMTLTYPGWADVDTCGVISIVAPGRPDRQLFCPNRFNSPNRPAGCGDGGMRCRGGGAGAWRSGGLGAGGLGGGTRRA